MEETVCMLEKKQSTKSNFAFQIIYQALIYLVPFLVTPYLTRILGAGPLGIYSYANSIAYYFVIIAQLGIARYGQREIARDCGNKKATSKTFWSLFIDHAFSSLLSIVAYSILAFTIFADEGNIYPITILYVASAFFDITWLFLGIEQFKIVTLIKSITTICKAICIFAFIKSPNDLWLYMLFIYAWPAISYIALFPIAVKTFGFAKVSAKDCLKHIIPLLTFSITVIASTLYTVFDKTLIGLMINTDSVAFYEQAEKIVNLPKVFILSIGLVLFPRICALEIQNNQKEINKYINIALTLTSMFGIGAGFGLLAVGYKFAVLYLGADFETSGYCLMAMSPLVYLVTMEDLFRSLYILPKKKDNLYVISICLTSVINLISSIILIKYLGVYGAIVGTIIAETFGFVLQGYFSREYFSVRKIVLRALPFLVCGAIMYGLIFLFDWATLDSPGNFILSVFIGGASFLMLSAIYLLLIDPNKEYYRSFVKKIFSKKSNGSDKANNTNEPKDNHNIKGGKFK
jgi:O-antigen/teichoic acid export membrane protein